MTVVHEVSAHLPRPKGLPHGPEVSLSLTQQHHRRRGNEGLQVRQRCFEAGGRVKDARVGTTRKYS